MSTNEDFDSYRDELMSMGAKIGLVTNTREAMNIKELSTTKGEYLEASTLLLIYIDYFKPPLIPWSQHLSNQF